MIFDYLQRMVTLRTKIYIYICIIYIIVSTRHGV